MCVTWAYRQLYMMHEPQNKTWFHHMKNQNIVCYLSKKLNLLVLFDFLHSNLRDRKTTLTSIISFVTSKGVEN